MSERLIDILASWFEESEVHAVDIVEMATSPMPQRIHNGSHDSRAGKLVGFDLTGIVVETDSEKRFYPWAAIYEVRYWKESHSVSLYI